MAVERFQGMPRGVFIEEVFVPQQQNLKDNNTIVSRKACLFDGRSNGVPDSEFPCLPLAIAEVSMDASRSILPFTSGRVRPWTFAIALLLIVTFACTAAAAAQSGAGHATGIVLDPSGRPVAGARVQLDSAFGAHLASTTGSAGGFMIALPTRAHRRLSFCRFHGANPAIAGILKVNVGDKLRDGLQEGVEPRSEMDCKFAHGKSEVALSPFLTRGFNHGLPLGAFVNRNMLKLFTILSPSSCGLKFFPAHCLRTHRVTVSDS